MGNTAILIGNSEYRTLDNLSCCRDDLLAMRELLTATNKYSDIVTIENQDANTLKSSIRTAIPTDTPPGELFLYYTGHGHQQETVFYLCAIDFDKMRPNETGLSTDDLHTFLRMPSADLVVKVIDACNSGTFLIKRDIPFESNDKSGFSNLIQFSSCRDFQNSFAGEPLSVFTNKFRAAALRQITGPVYYMDIASSLRDEFINDDEQTPFFVSQLTGRETFVDDAHCLDDLRNHLTGEAHSSARTEAEDEQEQLAPTSTTMQTLLERAEQEFGYCNPVARDTAHQLASGAWKTRPGISLSGAPCAPPELP